jgi:dTDP-4-dehydrorhamnose 3,5-epimerase
MKVVDEALNGLIVFEPNVFFDNRGSFFESYNEQKIISYIGKYDFVQDNHSVSVKNVIRGLHFQIPPHEQGKLVRVVSGAALDVAVDIRKNSPSYGQVYKVELNSSNNYMFWIPPGFAHGFSSLQNNTVFLYKCTALYNKNSECTIAFNDENLNIDWGVSNPIISQKDLEGISLENFNSPFIYK